MTGRERALEALAGRLGDRPARYCDLQDPETIRKLGGAGDPLRSAAKALRALGVDMTREMGRIPFTSTAPPPSPRGLDERLRLAREAFNRAVDVAGDDFLVLLEFPYSLMGALLSTNGTLDALTLLASEPARAAALLEEEGRRCRALAEAVAGWGDVDAVLFMDDLAGNRGSLVSPETLRALYFPRLREILDLFARADILTIFHSDGDLTTLHKDILSAGARGHHPVEPVGNWSLPTAADRPDVVLVGNASIARLAQSVDSARAERDRCLAFASTHRAYFQAPASEIGPEVPLEHLDAFFS